MGRKRRRRAPRRPRAACDLSVVVTGPAPNGGCPPAVQRALPQTAAVSRHHHNFDGAGTTPLALFLLWGAVHGPPPARQLQPELVWPDQFRLVVDGPPSREKRPLPSPIARHRVAHILPKLTRQAYTSANSLPLPRRQCFVGGPRRDLRNALARRGRKRQSRALWDAAGRFPARLARLCARARENPYVLG